MEQPSNDERETEATDHADAAWIERGREEIALVPPPLIVVRFSGKHANSLKSQRVLLPASDPACKGLYRQSILLGVTVRVSE